MTAIAKPAGLESLLRELEAFGTDNDARITDRPQRMLNITRDTGEFLSVLVRATQARRILEIGTSNGYSTLWLAHAAAETGGQVTTVECSPFKIAMAAANFQRSGLSNHIVQIERDAGDFLRTHADESCDLLFLDSERGAYCGWWQELKRVLARGGLLVVDNALSHAGEMAAFIDLVTADGEFACCTVPVGNGEFMAHRAKRPTG